MSESDNSLNGLDRDAPLRMVFGRSVRCFCGERAATREAIRKHAGDVHAD